MVNKIKLTNIRYKILIVVLAALNILFFQTTSIMADSNPNIILENGFSYLILFDNTISQYKLNNATDYNIEVPTNIFNEKNEFIIKPVKDGNAILSVQSGSNNYTISISSTKSKNQTISGISTISPDLFILQIDKPTVLNKKSCLSDFEIYKPPKL